MLDYTECTAAEPYESKEDSSLGCDLCVNYRLTLLLSADSQVATVYSP